MPPPEQARLVRLLVEGVDYDHSHGFGQGGAINSFANLTALNCTLTDNLAMGGALAPGAGPTNLSEGSASNGGAIVIGGPFTLTLTNSTLVSNQVIGGAGGAGSAGSLRAGAARSWEPAAPIRFKVTPSGPGPVFVQYG